MWLATCWETKPIVFVISRHFGSPPLVPKKRRLHIFLTPCWHQFLQVSQFHWVPLYMSQLTGNPSLPLPCARKTKWGSLICIPLRFPLQGRLFPLFQTELGGGQKQERGNQPIFPPEKLIGEKRRMQKKEMKKKKQCKKVFSKPLQTPIACSILYVSISRLCIHSSYYRLLLNMPQNIVHFLLSSVEKKGGGRRK